MWNVHSTAARHLPQTGPYTRALAWREPLLMKSPQTVSRKLRRQCLDQTDALQMSFLLIVVTLP